ncbi:MAG: fumarylacetoacetate hydrolase family protein [Pseudomonadota bacterium]
MDQAAITEAVSAFAQARKTVSTIGALAESARPASIAEGYAIQDASIAAWGRDIVGWKVGATNTAALELFGLDEPFYGPIFAGTIFNSPATLPSGEFQHYCLESEFAFRLGSDLPAPDGKVSLDDVAAAVSEVIPAFEIISPRFDGVPKGDGACAIADCGIGAGLVIGAPHVGLDGLDLVGHAVSLSIDGKTVAEGTGSLVMGHPLEALAWTARTLASHGKMLKAGEVITTGTTTGVQFVEVGATCIADFGSLGTVEAIFA